MDVAAKALFIGRDFSGGYGARSAVNVLAIFGTEAELRLLCESLGGHPRSSVGRKRGRHRNSVVLPQSPQTKVAANDRSIAYTDRDCDILI